MILILMVEGSGSATLISGRTCTPTPSCPEAPPCTPVSPTGCRRRSPPWPPPPSRSRSSLPREEVLRLDRRIHPGLPLHLPADVDLRAGVRRVRTLHCPPQVLLILLFHLFIKLFTNATNTFLQTINLPCTIFKI